MLKYLVIGPGAMGYFAILGHLSTLDLTQVKEISGSSAGSILGLMICLGYSITDILDLSLIIDVEKIYNSKSLAHFMKNFGMIKTSDVRKLVLQATEGQDPTFEELDKVLYVAAYCVNLQKTVYFSKVTHPHMKVIDAVCMSISVPFIFSSVTYDGYTYIDGGTEEKVPVTPFIDKPVDDVYAIEIINSDTTTIEINSFMDFLKATLTMILKNRYTCHIKHKKSIVVPIEQLFDFRMSLKEKLQLYSCGFI